MSRTYRKGQQIDKLIDAIAYILAQANFCIPGGFKGYHVVPAKFIENWSVRHLDKTIKAGRLHLAEKH